MATLKVSPKLDSFTTTFHCEGLTRIIHGLS